MYILKAPQHPDRYGSSDLLKQVSYTTPHDLQHAINHQIGNRLKSPLEQSPTGMLKLCYSGYSSHPHGHH